MVKYNFKVYVPSLSRKISVCEITVRDLININKSIINGDVDETVDCFNQIIEQCCQEKDLILTLLDKVVILMSIRAYSVSPFCTLTIRDPDQGSEFEHILELDPLIKQAIELPIAYRKTYGENVIVHYGVPVNPIKNVNDIQTIDYIHSISHQGVQLMDYRAPRAELQELVDSLEYEFFVSVKHYAIDLYQVFEKNPLYLINSPFDRSKNLVTQKMSLDHAIYDLLKMLFTENLHNLYRSIYNFNKALNISPIYTENLIPVEKDLLWGYHLKDERDEQNAKNSGQKTGSFQP